MLIGADGKVRVKMAHPHETGKSIHRRVYPVDAREIVETKCGVLDPDPVDQSLHLPDATTAVAQTELPSETPAGPALEDFMKINLPKLREVGTQFNVDPEGKLTKKDLAVALHQQIGTMDEFNELFTEKS